MMAGVPLEEARQQAAAHPTTETMLEEGDL